MLDFINCNIEKLIVHQVGNKTNSEALRLSDELLNLHDQHLKDLLIQYFLHPLSKSELQRFTFSNKDFKLNPIYQFATSIFEETGDFKSISVDVAKHLYDISTHPNIKKGDLFFATFKDILIEDEMADAIGIFKSENRDSFLKLLENANNFKLNYDEGIGIDKLDKGCLIFNTEKDHGYKVCVVDKSNKEKEAQFWKEQFLNITPLENDYHYTKEFLNATKNYVSHQLAEDFEVSSVDKIDLLNRSVDYFKGNEQFEKEDFEQVVLQDDNLIKSFRSFNNEFQRGHDLDIKDSFEISNEAIKKQARFLKSVLKLDKNFHVYIHGDRSQIEQGTEADGRKYYKLYYKEEN